MLTVLEANTTRDVRKVLATRQLTSKLTTMLDATAWQTDEPGSYVNPRTFFEAIAGSTYYGNVLTTRPAVWGPIQTAIAASDTATADSLMYAAMTDRDSALGIHAMLDATHDMRAIVPTGMEFTTYEGGSHANHGPFGGAPVPSAAEQQWFTDYYNGANGAAEFEVYYQGLKAVLDAPPLWFRDIGRHVVGEANATGSWTLLRHNWDSTVR